MIQKELAKRLRGRFETEPDGDSWLAVSSDGMPLCRVKHNGNCIVNDKLSQRGYADFDKDKATENLCLAEH